MSEDAHNSDNGFDGALWKWNWEPEQIAQPLTPLDPDFSQDDLAFLRQMKIGTEKP
jgi:hypothetical protein